MVPPHSPAYGQSPEAGGPVRRALCLPRLAGRGGCRGHIGERARTRAFGGRFGDRRGVRVHQRRAHACFRDDVAFSAQWLRTDPGNVNANFTMGQALARQGQWSAALPYYEKANHIRPDHAYTHNNLGDTLMHLARVPEAVEHFQRAAALEPDYADARLNLGLALARLDRIDEAIGQFAESVRLKPDLAEAHSNLGIALARQGNLDSGAGGIQNCRPPETGCGRHAQQPGKRVGRTRAL